MQRKRLGFGLVGLGMGGETHAREVRAVKDADLIAVCGRSEDKVRRFAENFGAKRWYTDFSRMLEDRDIDIVSVLTPNGLHRDFAIAAAEAGKHVVVEKPIEITLDRADAIIAACRRNKVKLAVILQMRFGSAARKLKHALEAGALGRVFLADAYDKEYRTSEYYANDAWRGTIEHEGGGSLMTQSIHVVDLLQWLAGPIDRVFAKKRTAVHKIDVEDLVVASLTFRSGALGVLESSTCAYPAFKSRIEIHGERGSAIVNGEHDELMFWDIAGTEERVDAPPGFRFKDLSDPRLMPEVRHRIELQDVVDSILEGRNPQVTGEEGRKSLAIVQAIYESAKLGTEVSVPE